MAKRIEYLDSLRGLASIMVVSSHFVGEFGQLKEFYFTPLHLLHDGFAAVSVFFVLSGFVLTKTSFELGAPPTLRQFFVGRFFRIYPPFVSWVFLSYLLFWLFPDPLGRALGITEWFNSLFVGPVSFKETIKQALFLPVAYGYNFLPQGWTLYLELLLSVLVPALIVLVLGKRTWGAYLLVLPLAFGLNPLAVDFLLGILVASYLTRLAPGTSAIPRSFRPVVLVLALFLLSSRYTVIEWAGWNTPSWSSAAWIITGVGAAMLLMLCFSSPRLQRVLSTKVLRFIGKVSYSVYLLHFAVLVFITPHLVATFQNWGWSGPAVYLGAFFLSVVVIVLVAAVSYHLIEKPSIRFGKFVGRVWDRAVKLTRTMVPWEGGRALLARWRDTDRSSSAPYLSGDSFRSMAEIRIEIEDDLAKANLGLDQRRLVFCKAELVDRLFGAIERSGVSGFVVLSGNSDRNWGVGSPSVPTGVTRWYCQNLEQNLGPKVRPLPIGLENRHHQNAGIITRFERLRKGRPDRGDQILLSFNVATNPGERAEALKAAAPNPLFTRKVFSSTKAYQKALSRTWAVVSPPGNGLDCHRTWEALYLRVLPIVKRSYAMERFRELGIPLHLVDSWEELGALSRETLMATYQRLVDGFSVAPLWMDYWKAEIEADLGKATV